MRRFQRNEDTRRSHRRRSERRVQRVDQAEIRCRIQTAGHGFGIRFGHGIPDGQLLSFVRRGQGNFRL